MLQTPPEAANAAPHWKSYDIDATVKKAQEMEA
jgi:hypothetical protein